VRFTCCQLRVAGVFMGFYAEFIVKREMNWAKTGRFVVK
jgi:hypothetical protein